ncbi:MAG: TraB/GumN family protein [Flavobacteriales bacterium]|nr:TraB/GumN family protein [Flavobacteriales bacterium]
MNKIRFQSKFAVIVFAFTLLSSTLIYGQEPPKKYPSLLWEISGNGVAKPSYLYGTMHVSSKVAFHLGDTFFMALESCDAVALESDATQWLEKMYSTEYLEEVGDLYGRSSYYNDFYREGFSIIEFDKQTLGRSLNFNSRLMNGLLYRESDYDAEFEEETYLDMYIHQAGKKLNKPVIGLEDFMESHRLVQKSEIPDEDEEDRVESVDYRKIRNSGKNPGEMMQDAYRNGDLDMVDSLQRLMDPGNNHQKYMLHDRNIIMANRMDSIIQSGTKLFTGIGAAHLAGEKGVIELLRAKGYTLRPVVRNIDEYSKNYKNKLEKTYVKQDFKTYTTSDGWIEVKLPGKMFETPAYGGYKISYFPDMSNGATYSLTRLRYAGTMRNQDQDYMIKRIDSLLFENIPGKIIEQKEIKRNGFPGFDIINRTKKSDYQRYLIVATPLELIIFKVGGTLDYVKDNNNLEEVFSSLKIKGKTADWSTFHSIYGFDIDLPGTPITEEKDKEHDYMLGSDVQIQAMDGDEFFYVNRTSLHDYFYIEEDTFELSYISHEFHKEMKLEHGPKEFFNFNGRPAMKTTCKDSNKYLHSLYFVDGPRYYQLLAKTNSEEWPKQFFESFKFTQSKPIREEFVFNDTSYHYSVKTPVKRSGFANFDLREVSERVRNKENNRDYDGRRDYLVFQEPMSDQQVGLGFKQFSRYFYRSAYDTLWRSVKKDYLGSGLVFDVEKISEDSTEYDLVVSDTNSVRNIHFHFKVNGGILYSIRAVSEIGKPSPLYQSFVSSFTPNPDTVVGLPITQNKADIFFDDLLHGDSLAVDYAIQSVDEIRFEKQHLDKLIDVIENFKHKDYDISDKVDLIESMGFIKHRDVLPFLEKYYKQNVDTAQYQVAVLKALVNQHSKPATKLFKTLLEYETPLVDKSSVSQLTSRMSDSLTTYTDLFPFLLKFTRYPEYQSNVYDLMAEMVDSGVLKPKKYKSYKKDILREAKDELKRTISEANKASGGNSYRSYYYYEPSSTLEPYNTLLIPFKNQKDVQNYFERTKKLNDEGELFTTSVQMLEAGMDVNDTIWPHFANREKYLIKLYEKLKEINQLHLIPDSCLTQENIAKSMLYKYNSVTEKDSVQFLKRYEARNKDGEGYVYVFKKKDKYNDKQWEYDYIGIMPKDSTIVPKDYDVKDNGNDYIDEEELDKTMEDVIDHLLYADRKRVKEKRKYRGFYGY